MTAKPDMSNPLIATPVATIAKELFLDALRPPHAIPATRIQPIADAVVNCAEILVGELMNRGHLPRTLPSEEPKADDATLLLQAILFGIARWEPFGPGDARGEICFNGFRHLTKAVKGIPTISPKLREDLELEVARHIRKL